MFFSYSERHFSSERLGCYRKTWIFFRKRWFFIFRKTGCWKTFSLFSERLMFFPERLLIFFRKTVVIFFRKTVVIFFWKTCLFFRKTVVIFFRKTCNFHQKDLKHLIWKTWIHHQERLDYFFFRKTCELYLCEDRNFYYSTSEISWCSSTLTIIFFFILWLFLLNSTQSFVLCRKTGFQKDFISYRMMTWKITWLLTQCSTRKTIFWLSSDKREQLDHQRTEYMGEFCNSFVDGKLFLVIAKRRD